MRKVSANLFLILILTFGLTLSVSGQETVTITTFYPSPVGVYQDLLVTRGMAIGDTDGDGDVDVADLPLDDLDNPTEGFLVNTGIFFLGGNGDTNGDGTIAPNDVLLIINHLNSSAGNLTPAQVARADIDANGVANVLDVFAILSHLNTGGDIATVRQSLKSFLSDMIRPGPNASLDLATTPQWDEVHIAGVLSILDDSVGIGIADNIPQADLEVNNTLRLTPTDTPSHAIEGALYYDDSDDRLRVHTATGWQDVGSRPEIITCSHTGASPTLASSGNYYYTFTADDCGGTLPDTNYIGAIRTVEACNGIEHWRLFDPGETHGPGVLWYPDGTLCTWPGGSQFNVSALYIRYR